MTLLRAAALCTSKGGGGVYTSEGGRGGLYTSEGGRGDYILLKGGGGIIYS